MPRLLKVSQLIPVNNAALGKAKGGKPRLRSPRQKLCVTSSPTRHAMWERLCCLRLLCCRRLIFEVVLLPVQPEE